LELTALVVIGTDYIGSCKYNYHAIATVVVGIVLTSGKHLSDCIISLRGEAWVYITSLTLPLCFIKVSVPSQEGE
jgi:hypothetical protein